MSTAADGTGGRKQGWSPLITLLSASSFLLILVGLGFNELFIGVLLPSDLDARQTAEIRSSQVALLVPGAFLALLTLVAYWLGAPRSSWVGRALLAFLAAGLPLWILETTLRPFTNLPGEQTSGLYVRDAELGWRLNPGVEDRDIGGQRVRINAKGLRGAEVAYEKPAGIERILFLGDSVTYGWQLDEVDTFPRQVEERLEGQGGLAIESINAGVSGYSPWQEDLYLRREGVRYDPDVVVVCFVLNDAVEKFGLLRFGGSSEGFQLHLSALSSFEKIAARSALLTRGRTIAARLRYGRNVQAGAEELERLGVVHLVLQPHHPQVEMAWEITLANLGAMFDFCRERKIPLALVIFPFAFQFDDPGSMSAPQQRLADFGRERGVPVLDLLPPLVETLRRESVSSGHLFRDNKHLNPRGSREVAGLIADFLRDRELVGGERLTMPRAAPGAR